MTSTAASVEPATVTTPWMTVKEAAAYSRRHEKTVRTALHEYVSSRGRRGLRGSQPAANCTWRLRREDVDAWLAGEAPRHRAPQRK